MSRSKIITLPNPHLRKQSKKIDSISDDVKNVIKDMKESTILWEESRPHELGVALAAVQIDKLYRIVIIRDSFEDKDNKDFITLINPEITKVDGRLEYDYEGCLSVKDIYGLVPRYSKVRIKALNEEGEKIRFKATGFLARVLQHEVDHTNGIVFIDHIKNNDAFFRLGSDGELEKVEHSEVLASDILW